MLAPPDDVNSVFFCGPSQGSFEVLAGQYNLTWEFYDMVEVRHCFVFVSPKGQ